MKNLVIDQEQAKKWAKNLFKFTAPAVAALFGQLALGVSLKQASLFALIILYGLLADYFSKLK